jgi:hypothetical protein
LWRAEARAIYGPRLGTKEIILVRASPKYFRLAPYHESERESWKEFPGTIKAWAKRLPEAPFIINGGQYYPNRDYMGSLKRQGKDLGGPAHTGFKGFLVQDPLTNEAQEPQAKLMDLELSPMEASSRESSRESSQRTSQGSSQVSSEASSEVSVPDGYGTVIQSYMVLDRLGRIRVKATDKLASRAVLGFDKEGWAVCVVVKGAITLKDLALLSKKLGLVSALGLDGGLETQLAFNLKNETRFWQSGYTNNFLGNLLVENLSPSLPSVISFERLARPEGQPETEPTEIQE